MQRLPERDERRDDVTGAVGHRHLVGQVRIVDLGRVDPDVVDADPLVVRHVVVDGHPPLAHHRRAPHLVRVEPADVHERMCRREVQPQVGDVLPPRADVAVGPHRRRHRQLVQQEGGDRDVVRRQVPDDVHVALVQAQVQPGRVDVEHAAELPGPDDLPQLPDRRVVLEGVADHQMHVVHPRPRRPVPPRPSPTWPAASRRGRACPLSSARRRPSTWLAGGVATSTASTRSSTSSIRSAGRLHRRVVRRRLAKPTHVAVHDGHRNVRHGAQHPDVLAPPVPVTDDGHVHVLSHLLPPNAWCSRTLDHVFYTPPNDVRRRWRACSSDRYFVSRTPAGSDPCPVVREFVDWCYTHITLVDLI